MLQLLLVIVVIASANPPTTEQETRPTVPPRGTASTLLEGMWPSSKLQNLILLRVVNEVAYEYDLDEDQQREFQDKLMQRWTPFLEKHRAQVEPVMSEFLEMRISLEPPSAERIQGWAKQAEPVFDSLRKEIDEGNSDFRKLLRPAQRAKFELDTLTVGAGLGVAEHRLNQLQAGGFDPKAYSEFFWHPSASEREKRRRRPTRASKVVEDDKKQPTDQISLELASWDTYVAEFIKIYNLNEGQRTAALSCLSELKQRALDHRDRRRVDIARLEERIAGATGGKEELADLRKQLTELYGPIDDMFQDLKLRIEPIPTAEQRAAVDTSRNEENSSREPSAPRDRSEEGSEQ